MSVRRPNTLRAYSLIELLTCVAIIAILVTIGVVTYQGALDQGDLKYAAPVITGRLEGKRREAAERNEVIIVEFKIGTDEWLITTRGGDIASSETQSLESLGVERLIKRDLRFLKYDWPEGGSTPATFTFTGSSAPQGGSLHYGTRQAETIIKVQGGRVVCELGERLHNGI